MMRRSRLFCATWAPVLALSLMLGPAPVVAQGAGTGPTVAAQAAKASEELRASVAALQAASTGRDRVAALTQRIRAYEEGLAALREALRQAQLREATLKMRFNAKRDEVAQLLAVLARMEQNPGPMLLLHPTGPLGSARSGMMVAEVTPALQAEANMLRGELQELADLRSLQAAAGRTLTEGLSTAQEARTALSKAISDRKELPKRMAEDPEVLRDLLSSADTLDSFAAGLAFGSQEGGGLRPFISALGELPLPVIGTLIRMPDEADAAGVRRPGMSLATRPGALITAPWPATIRYLGPLLDYGNVIILEPGDGYLLIMAGLDVLYGEVGEVVALGAPLGLMGNGSSTPPALPDPDLSSVSTLGSAGAGADASETLYLELRLGAAPVDPTEWFAATATPGD